jgi:acyl carrier protein
MLNFRNKTIASTLTSDKMLQSLAQVPAEITEKIKDIIVGILEIPIEKLVPAAGMSEDLEVDSLDRYEIIWYIEQEFGIYLPDDTLQRFPTVAAFVLEVARKVSEKK